MNKKILIPACLIASIFLVLNFLIVLAHETVTVDDYELEIGWLTEPPITGQMNGIIVNVTKGDEEEPVEDVSDLVVNVLYGGQSKALILQPLGEETPGQFVAPILPAAAGQYTVHLGGKLGDTAVSADVEPEEVQSPIAIQFPILDVSSQSNSFGFVGWLAVLGVILGLAGIGIGAMALRKKN